MTPDDFITAVREHIDPMHHSQALKDLEELLGSGISPDELGDPEDYAAMMSEPPDGTEPVSYGRVWDPTNPRLFVRRVIGWGWDVNLAAVAVRLGWMRPDDLDSDVLSAAPEGAVRLSRLLPAAGAAAAAVASAVAATRSDGSLPSGWDVAFRPNRFASTGAALAPGCLLSAGAALWASRAMDRHDQLTRSVYASSLAFIGAGASMLAARSTWVGDRAQPLLGIAALFIGPAAAGLAAGLIPIRAGLEATWSEAGLRA